MGRHLLWFLACLGLMALPIACAQTAQPTPAATQAAQPLATASPATPTSAQVAVPTAIPTPTRAAAVEAAGAVTGVWVDRKQPDTVRIEFKDGGALEFSMRVKATSAGNVTYGEWSKVATVEWRQIGQGSVQVSAAGTMETWQLRDGVLIQPTKAGTTEFIRQ